MTRVSLRTRALSFQIALEDGHSKPNSNRKLTDFTFPMSRRRKLMVSIKVLFINTVRQKIDPTE